MRKKTASEAQPSATKVAKPRKAAAPSLFAAPSPNGQPVTEEAIRICAYRKWESAGKPDGEAVRFWLDAEQELSQGK